ncbi:NADP-dependent oxidoreductase [Cellulophaga lytica]|uniref:2-alkenal reductase n=1 Tax=Cellulophaga lytica (strain ATCC 23178 / DSM 7489 / JCM 8516 / NBRC 14961 / NCIMB 1423 / VKM B-1433 / Cy l20) TaxID=867900 RepID=F0RBK9_CELLC|nr:NADP-dependent oxidoreductase [Cellulophaga lytica]ADY30659.1 2-alkenal reductase [Cellulophaga lytica DSM 7489]AIM61643.1 alcohol dehydrogenase [Cellulophaga lytica]WQG78414.1 NADP-dependent oxidoreductase [Cellulophaga lytica]SNQ44681.1 Probable NADP-dependent oxidoreductase [Cellulophaga lytica]
MIQTILLKNRPVGRPAVSDFEFVKDESDISINDGEILLETTYVSVDPYLRGRMSDAKSYVPPFELNKPIHSGVIAKVIASKNESFAEGDFVSGMLDWKTQQVSTGEGLLKVDKSKAPLSAYLGILGMTGLTAYLGLTEIGKPKAGETLVVSGAAGAVGSVVGQIGKILGLNVIGIAGTDEKVEMLKSKFGFDAGINYNTTENMTAAIAEAAPNGVDVYFDNVGGPISDAVLFNINKFARIIICGAISVYNNTELPKSISVQPFLVKNSALMQGFIVSNYADKFPEAMKELSTWLAQDKLTYTETIVEGFENIPTAFIDLFDGKNKGKMIVKI